MNPPIRRLAMVVAFLFTCLLVSSTTIMFFQSKSLAARSDNRRSLLASYDRERGQILVGGTPIAKSVPSQDDLRWERSYPAGALYSHVTGYYSFTYGAGGGIEGAEDDILSGRSDKLFYRRLTDLVSGRQPAGASVELTIDPRVQQAADAALGDQRGAVVALDPRTGAILAMVSHPSYDPAQLSSHRFAEVTQAWKSLTTGAEQPLVNRAIGGNLYPPGSVFKLVTTAAALSSGKYTQDTRIPAPAQLPLPQSSTPLTNWQNGRCTGSTEITLQEALETSCNSAFGGIGIALGGDALRDQAAKFGFGDDLRVPMRVTPSSVPAGMDKAQSAQAAIGQYDVRVTPLQVAMVSAAIANKGVVMKPYLVKSVRGDNLAVLDRTDPAQLSKAMTSEQAQTIARMMQSVVENGTGSNARISGVAVGGKTGTAQQGNGRAPHAWFTAIAPLDAPDDKPQVAVAVVVEDGGTAGRETGGNKAAAPIAKKVIQAVIGQ
ncbi:peptidoglycan D,D-transpeptidase FtsI family protein [Arsenicicoccus sp. oral taxon 190]|uniref:peptidoglycan D,D-transpeptidase FtsI family protein n=1 Tax=Arsenicicoccus sp. oral taxon 190 TaxID=1658671 RepID=UPI00067A2615|nr:penicillin-binding protein 2 [Arsenicicoccus sp. oral taxon 190]AKT50836.1 cell division protein FtsI [Arsenicicoccus sp. oral taxon 190]